MENVESITLDSQMLPIALTVFIHLFMHIFRALLQWSALHVCAELLKMIIATVDYSQYWSSEALRPPYRGFGYVV